jgi:hypothetical protein
MVFEKAAYWIAVGVLALCVGNHFAARQEDGVRRFASRSLAVIEQVSGDATGFMATAETMLGRGGPRFAQSQTTLACAQTRLASVQTLIAQHEGALARVEAEHARMFAMQPAGRTIFCPRHNLKVVIPDAPAIRIAGTI